jgi:hypothetical protein
VNDDNAHRRRRRGVWLGLLLGLSLALAGVGYALSSSPSVPTRADKPSASPSSQVLAPSTGQTASPGVAGANQVVLAPAATGTNGNGNGNGNGNCLDPASESSSCQHSFGVTVGQSPLLYPGVLRSLPVTFTNPNNFDIYVTTYRVSVSVPASKAVACPASSLQVPSGTVTLSPRLTSPRNASVTTTVPVKLGPNAPEGCQQVPFSITVNATAVKK